MSSDTQKLDVIIVGAGLAGLYAARLLTQQGKRVHVIEAQDRVGGRTLSGTFGAHKGDLGGQWIGAKHHTMRKLIAELGLYTTPTHTQGRKLIETGGKISSYTGTIPKVSPLALIDVQLAMTRLERIAKRIPHDRPASTPEARRLDALSVAAWRTQHMRTAAARDMLDAAVRSVFCVEPEELSMLFFLHHIQAGGGLQQAIEAEGGAQQDVIIGGAQQVSLRMAKDLGDRITLQAPARRIQQDDHGVTVYSDHGATWNAQRAIIAIPPHMIPRIDFSPALPAQLDQHLQRSAMGASIKFLATYKRPFWREQGLSGEFAGNGGPVQLTFDACAADGSTFALVGFIMGRAARQASALTPTLRRAEVLADLGRIFGPQAHSPLGYWDKDWLSEPWTRGCPVASHATGTLSQTSVTPPSTGLIHWIGTECSGFCPGYMEGAVQSAGALCGSGAALRLASL